LERSDSGISGLQRLLKDPHSNRADHVVGSEVSMNNAGILRICFAANIVILVPVCWSMFLGNSAAVFDGTVTESAGLRLLVGSLWTAILVASIAGIAQPKFFAPVVLIQVFYKAMWLLTFVLPAVRSHKDAPVGISIVFLLIVLTYPILFWFAR
jgi:hypothetical protein